MAKTKAAPLLGGLEEGDAATLECLYCPLTSRSHVTLPLVLRTLPLYLGEIGAFGQGRGGREEAVGARDHYQPEFFIELSRRSLQACPPRSSLYLASTSIQYNRRILR